MATLKDLMGLISEPHMSGSAFENELSTLPAQASSLIYGVTLKLSLSMGHGLDRSDPPTHVDRTEILTSP